MDEALTGKQKDEYLAKTLMLVADAGLTAGQASTTSRQTAVAQYETVAEAMGQWADISNCKSAPGGFSTDETAIYQKLGDMVDMVLSMDPPAEGKLQSLPKYLQKQWLQARKDFLTPLTDIVQEKIAKKLRGYKGADKMAWIITDAYINKNTEQAFSEAEGDMEMAGYLTASLAAGNMEDAQAAARQLPAAEAAKILASNGADLLNCVEPMFLTANEMIGLLESEKLPGGSKTAIAQELVRQLTRAGFFEQAENVCMEHGVAPLVSDELLEK